MVDDMGLTPAEQMRISKSYQAAHGLGLAQGRASTTFFFQANMAVIYEEIFQRGMFSWQQQWNGQSSPTAKNGCCTRLYSYGLHSHGQSSPTA